jgi:hypothetical protein
MANEKNKEISIRHSFNCCRRQHTILNMKYCVYVCPASLAELCIAERELDFVHVCLFVRMIRFMTYFDVTEI